MKTLRIVGSVCGGLLMPIFIILLCTMILVSNTAGMLTEANLQHIISTSIRQEGMKNAISDMLASELIADSATEEEKTQMKETVNQLLARPSFETLVADIVSDTVSEVMSGNFNGEIDISKKLNAAITSDTETLNQITVDLTNVMLENDSLRKQLTSSYTAGTIFDDMNEENKDMILTEPAVKEVVSNVLAESLKAELTGTAREPIDIAQKIKTLLIENPSLAATFVIAYGLDDEAKKETVMQEATDHAEQIGAKAPSENLSDLEMLLYLVDLYQDELNAAFNESFTGADIDFVPYAPDIAYDASESDNTVIKFDEETTEMINTLASFIHFFRSVAFIAMIIGVFVLLYLLMALLTWSFRHPLIFSGITAVLTGILLLVIGLLPIHDILALIIETGETTEIIFAFIDSAWSVLSDKLILLSVISILVGILMITGFIVIGILAKKKQIAPTAT